MHLLGVGKKYWTKEVFTTALYGPFSADGEMRLDFDDNDSAIGQWSALSSANRYSFSFQQYPDAAKRVFSLSLDFSSNKGKVTISDDGSTSHWVRNRVLNRME